MFDAYQRLSILEKRRAVKLDNCVSVNYARPLVDAAPKGEKGCESFRVGDHTPGVVWAVGNRPRSNGCLAPATGCAFIPRVYPRLGSTGQIDQH